MSQAVVGRHSGPLSAVGRATDLPGSEEIGGAREVVGGRGETGLEVRLGEAPPAHPPEAIRAFPGSEDLLDPPSYPMDRTVPFGQSAPGFPLHLRIRRGPHPHGRDPGCAAPRPHRLRESTTTVGTVGVHLARIRRQGTRAMVAVMDVARRDRKLLHERRLGVRSHVHLVPMHRFPAAVPRPTGFGIVPTGGAHHARIHQRARLDAHCPAPELVHGRVEQHLIQAVPQEFAAKPDKGRALRCRLRAGKPAEPSERCPILQRFRQLDVRQIVPDPSSSARNNAKGGQPASPRGAAYTTDNRASIGDQSMRSAIASRPGAPGRERRSGWPTSPTTSGAWSNFGAALPLDQPTAGSVCPHFLNEGHAAPQTPKLTPESLQTRRKTADSSHQNLTMHS